PSYLVTRKTRNKEGEHSLIGFMALYLVPVPKFFGPSNPRGHLPTPRFGPGPWIRARVGSHRCPVFRPGAYSGASHPPIPIASHPVIPTPKHPAFRREAIQFVAPVGALDEMSESFVK